MTLPEIKTFLAEQNLRFIGLEVDRGTARHYTARFPDDTTMTDLDQWHAFEQDNPQTFATMYRFWVQAPRAELSPTAGRPRPPWSRSRCR